MNDLSRLVGDITRLLLRAGEAFVSWLEAVEISFRDQMTIMGVSPPVQTVLMVLAAIALIVLSVRLFGGLIRFAVILILALLAINLLLPSILHWN
jgi:hypothetical protein